MHVNGENFQALAIDEASIYISPDITINNTQGIIDISGTLTIPKATITPTQLPASAVTISDDQVIVDSQEQQISVKTQQKITTNIEVILKDDVFVEGFGFKGNTIGNLQITKAVDGPTLGRGEIRIANGEYRAYGQGLVIDKGNILFAGGPVNKPGIDLKALRRPAENITVGVFARGTIAEPTLTIFSEPAMSQQEQLSWLILGRPLEQSSEGESNALSQLLLSLSLSKGDAIVKGFGDTFKLDTVRIKTGSDEAGAASDNDLAELVLGKYLTPDLYVSYGIGLFKPVNVLSLEYSLGRRWKLKTESSAEAAGGDLIYTIEK
jgi:translocation and assembly module TamB